MPENVDRKPRDLVYKVQIIYKDEVLAEATTETHDQILGLDLERGLHMTSQMIRLIEKVVPEALEVYDNKFK